MTTEYLIWDEEFSEENADFKQPKSLNRIFYFNGYDITPKLPEGPFEFTHDPYTGRKLRDYIHGIHAFFMNHALKATLDELGIDNIQYFPCLLMDSKNKLMSDDYFFTNVVGTWGCIDIEKSEYTVDPFREEHFDTMTRIVLDQNKINPDLKLFRLGKFTETLLIRSDLAKIIGERHTGIYFKTLDEYNDELAVTW